MFSTLRRLLGSDRAENSLMVVISQMLSTILLVALGGLMFVLITGGLRIQAENGAQTELRIANRAFITDVEQAASVQAVDDTRVVLTSVGWLKDEDGADLCRASEWFIAPASAETQQMRGDGLMSLYNDISIYPDADCSGAPSVQNRTAVSAISADSRFVYTNLAGVDLTFSNSTLIALNGENFSASATGSSGQANALHPDDEAAIDAFRSTWGIDTWYIDAEVVREVPRIIDAQLTAILPITEVNATSFTGTTNEAETELVGNNDGIVNPGGEQTRWIPNPVTSVFINRSTNPSTGTIVGGEREGVTMSWPARPTSECSPTQTPTYAWTLDDSSGRRTQGETTATSVEVEDGQGQARIWNGGVYEGTVTVRCNDNDGSSGVTRGTGSLSLPSVLGVTVSAPGAETAQNVVWERASSDPSTTYTVRLDRASATSTYLRTTPIDVAVWMRSSPSWTALGTTGSLSFGHTTPGAVPGFPETYAVRAATADSPNTSGVWSPGNYIYSSGTAASPSITALDEDSMAWASVGCPAGNSTSYQGRVAPSDGAAASTGIITTRSMTFPTIGQGARVLGYAQARCSTTYSLDPTNGQSGLSPWSAEATATYIRGVSPPSGITMNGGNVTVPNGSYATRYGVSVDGCAPGTSGAWVSGNASVGGSLSNTSRTSTPLGYCDGAYADSGPISRSVTITWYTPPAPSTPSGGSWDGRRSTISQQILDATFYGSGSSNATGYTSQVRVYATGGDGNTPGWKAWTTTYNCIEASYKEGRAMASGPGGSSGWYSTGQIGWQQYLQGIPATC